MPRIRSFALLALVVATAFAANAQATDAKAIVYSGAALFDGTGAALRPDMAIVTQNERITAVIPESDLSRIAPANAEIIDVHGQFVIPGLINSHVHLATTPDPVSAKAYLRRDLYSGVTAVRDMAGDARLLAELSREAQFNEIASPDIYYAALMAGPEFFKDPRTHQSSQGWLPGRAPWMRAIARQTDLRLAIAEAHGTGATAIKIYADLPAFLVRAISAEAHRQHMLVWAHAAVFPASPRDVVEADVDVASHACMLGYQAAKTMPRAYHNRTPVNAADVANATPTMEKLFAEMKKRGTILDATLYVYDEMWRVPHADPPPYCTLALAELIAGEAYRAGIPISAGTDGEADRKAPYSALDDELELLVQKAGMTSAEAIRAATVTGARTIGEQSAMGTIEPGKLANFVFLAKNPLDGIANLRTVVITVKHGKIYRRDDYKPITKDEAKSEM